MIYHYTTIPAFESILKDVDTRSQLCFWATRYDCFVDTEELKLGVETIQRLLPEVGTDVQLAQYISSLFDWDQIKNNDNLPYPYIVSFTSRPNNDYMWKEYAKMGGVAMEIDDKVSVDIPDIPLLRLASCVYADVASEDRMKEMIRQEYIEVKTKILEGPLKNQAYALSQSNPQMFAKLIALGMIFVTAPRIKKAKDYWMEEETRVIIPLPNSRYNELIVDYDEMIMNLGFNPSELRTLFSKERMRHRDDGTTVYYREMYLPVSLFKGVYVQSLETKEHVEVFLRSKGIDVPVQLV